MKDISTRRDRIVEAVLPHVAFDGWTPRALTAAANDLGLDSSEISRAFPEGTAEVVEHFSDLADRWMIANLETGKSGDLSVHETISLAMRLRLQHLAPHREAVRRALAFLTLPGHQILATRCTYRTVDAIWRALGDRSTDFNFYSKRFLLAGVYTATVLCWLGDDSSDFEKTWRFLDRRILDVVSAIRARRRLTKSISGIVSGFQRRRPIFGR